MVETPTGYQLGVAKATVNLNWNKKIYWESLF